MLFNNDRFLIKSGDKFIKFVGIDKLTKTNQIKIHTNTDSLVCAPGHKILTTEDFIEAQYIKKNDYIMFEDDINEKVTKIEFIEGEFEYYDIIESEDHRYNTNRIISHNCKFLASAASLVTADIVEKMEFGVPLEFEDLPIYDNLIGISEKFERWINVYEEPIPGHEYTMGVDPAKITEESSGDSLALQVFDITEIPFVQCATVIIPSGLHYWSVPDVIEILGKWYNEAWIFVENNDSVGQEIADALRIDFEYENLFKEKPGVEGFRTSKKNKKVGCLTLKMLIEDEKIKINDLDTIAELSTFVKVKNSYKAEPGYGDDAVMAAIHSFIWTQDRMGFEDKRELIKQMNNRGLITPKPLIPKIITTETKSLWDENQPTDFFSNNDSDNPLDDPENRPFG